MITHLADDRPSSPPAERGGRFWLALVLIHLALVACGAASVDLSEYGIIGRTLAFYGEISGSGSSYGFFAPGIWGQLRVLVDVTDSRGAIRTVGLETGASHEADLRVGDIIEQFMTQSDDTAKFQRSMAASLAGTMFARYPLARGIGIRLDHFDPVSMDDYRHGKRPHWSPVYEAKFTSAKKRHL